MTKDKFNRAKELDSILDSLKDVVDVENKKVNWDKINSKSMSTIANLARDRFEKFIVDTHSELKKEFDRLIKD